MYKLFKVLNIWIQKLFEVELFDKFWHVIWTHMEVLQKKKKIKKKKNLF